MSPRAKIPHLVLGAGCAGLSLAVALVRCGVRERIVVLDRREAYGRDRTWCFWEAAPVPFAEHASHAFAEWSIATPEAESVGSWPGHPYLHLASDDFYAAALDELAAHPNVELRLGCPVGGFDERDGAVAVRAGSETLRAERAYDALGAGSPAMRSRSAGGVELWQRFLGLEVRTPVPAFDPARCTLMDFRVSQDRGLRFLYVLPLSETRALVEDTSIGTRAVPAGERRAAVAELLAARGVGSFEILREERGAIPMSAHRFALRPSPRVHAVGLAGGAARPSSGYAFVRIQRHCAALAAAVAEGGPAPARLAPARRDWLDRVFLGALAADPGAFPDRFRRMLERTPADAFVRFMSDAGGAADDARVIGSLPKLPFASAALRPLRSSVRSAVGSVRRRCAGPRSSPPSARPPGSPTSSASSSGRAWTSPA